MKSTKQAISDVIKEISHKQKTQYFLSSYDRESELSPLELIPIEFTGIIEDYLFKESGEIFQILKQQSDLDIEGLTFQEIKNDSTKKAYYDRVKLNIPKYYSLKPSERQKHFKLEGELYLQKLAIKINQPNQQPQLVSPKKNISREVTPMKSKRISKKQTKNIKKQQKKNNNQNQQGLQKEFQQLKNNLAQKENFETPQKKQKQKKQVKFLQFQYVKDFSQYKTPRNLLAIVEYIEPLRERQSGKEQQ